MAHALVGARGVVTQGTSGVAITPAWGTGQNRVAGNLLVAWFAGFGSTTIPATPSGWNGLLSNTGTLCSSAIFWKIATGGDTAPTFALVASTILTAQLSEFTGNVSSSPVVSSGGVAGTGTPQSCSNAGNPSAIGELYLVAWGLKYSVAATKTFTSTLNNGMVADVSDDAGTSNLNHYHFVFGITKNVAAADNDSLAFTTTNISSVVGQGASFRPALPRSRQAFLGQAVNRSVTRCLSRSKSSILIPRLWTPREFVI